MSHADSDPRVAHVVRRYGGVTEPFIQQRLRAPGQRAELWVEREDQPFEGRSRLVNARAIRPGTLGDKVLHRFPSVARLARGPYAAAEQSTRPDVIHAHYLTTGYVVGKATRTPLVVSTYGFDVSLMPRRSAWRRAIRDVVPRVHTVLVEGPHMRRAVARLGFPDERIEIVPIAAGLQDVTYRGPTLAGERFQVLVCGRMVEKKGHDLALKAFSEAAGSLPPASTLRVVGDGPLMPRLKALAASLPVANRVTFAGGITRAEWLRELAASHMVLVPSRTASNGDSEGGAPTTILDAQATGVIVIGSTHADIPFLIEDGVTGFLFEEGSLEGLRAAILKCATSLDRWDALAARARAQLEERHSDASVAGLLAQVHARAGMS